MTDASPADSAPSFIADAAEHGDGFRIVVQASDGRERTYVIPTATQQDFSAFYRTLAEDFDTRRPHVFAEPAEHPPASLPWRPLLTENVDPKILVGYGDPAVLKTQDGYWLVATSND